MNQKRIKQIVLSTVLLVFFFAITSMAAEKSAICFGENLSESEKTSLYKAFGISDTDKDSITVVTVSNEEEHKWLSEYVSDDIIGTRALSSAYVVLTEQGKGIEVTTDNITFCTPQMYKNALQTAGVTDANIIAAAPFEMSGTASLIGVLKAYEKISGTPVSEECIDAAVNEFIFTGELLEDTDNSFSAEELVSFLKEKTVSEGLNAEEIKQLINSEIEKRNIDLDEEKIDSLVKLLLKIESIKTVSEAIEEQISTQTYSVGKESNSKSLDGKYETSTQNIWNVILNKIRRFFESIFHI